MVGFERIKAVAAPLAQANVDTDKILAAEHLKTISRTGLGSKLFSTMRYDAKGEEKPDFILNRSPWRKAGILIAGENFGCGSSREHAPWALSEFGIACIIAPSFADIFYNNCFKNFMLPITLDQSVIETLLSEAGNPATCQIAIDLPTQTISRSNGTIVHFDIEPDRKTALLNGIDEITSSLQFKADILEWEREAKVISPTIPADIAIR
ncbi:MAG: 3-isopropylmalate dehydratase small subunit [Alteraurantiacibacter sp.]